MLFSEVGCLGGDDERIMRMIGQRLIGDQREARAQLFSVPLFM